MKKKTTKKSTGRMSMVSADQILSRSGAKPTMRGGYRWYKVPGRKGTEVMHPDDAIKMLDRLFR